MPILSIGADIARAARGLAGQPLPPELPHGLRRRYRALCHRVCGAGREVHGLPRAGARRLLTHMARTRRAEVLAPICIGVGWGVVRLPMLFWNCLYFVMLWVEFEVGKSIDLRWRRECKLNTFKVGYLFLKVSGFFSTNQLFRFGVFFFITINR